MSGTPTQRVAGAIQREMFYHVGGWIDNGSPDKVRCRCGHRPQLGELHQRHVAVLAAQAVIDAMQLTEETHTYEKFETKTVSGGEGVMRYGGQSSHSVGWRTSRRLVGPWVERNPHD